MAQTEKQKADRLVQLKKDQQTLKKLLEYSKQAQNTKQQTELTKRVFCCIMSIQTNEILYTLLYGRDIETELDNLIERLEQDNTTKKTKV